MLTGFCRLLTLTALAAAVVSAQPVMKWTRYEATLTTARSYAHPLQDVEVLVDLQAPSGARHTINAFWDGGVTWRFRFSPGETGRWRWTSRSSNDDAGFRHQGAFECVPYSGSNPLYLHGPIRVSANGHYFEHPDRTPFFWLGDTVWNGPLLAAEADWEMFLRDRERKGFNVIQFVTTRWSAAHADGSGRIPYVGTERIDIDPAFFQRLDHRADAINAHGMFGAPVLLWAHPSRPDLNPGIQLPEDQMILLARYMVARYGAHQMIWFLNGDGDYTGSNAEKWKRIGRATFANTHPDRLATMHPGRFRWMTDEFIGESWFHFNGYQSGHRDDNEHLRWLTQGPPAKSWQRQKPIPDVNLEPNYEAHRSRTVGATHTFDDFHVRRAAWWSLLVAPPSGVTYGAHGIWSWESHPAEPVSHTGTGIAPPWHQAMRLPGSVDMQHLKSFFSTLQWTELKPAQDVLAAQPGASDPTRFIAAARSGEQIVIYIPRDGQVKMRNEPTAGFNRARWFNPRTGEWSPAKAAADQLFAAPSATQDWVLVLDRSRHRERLIVLTDIGGDPDDQQSMVRLMTYANEFDLEGLIASASGTPGELKQHLVQPALIRDIVDAYAKVRPNLIKHAEGYPTVEQLHAAVKSGNPFRGESAVGADKDTEGSKHIIEVVDRSDDRRVNIAVWGGPTDLAQALWRVRNDRTPAELRRFISKIRVHAIGHQDDSGPWILANFPDLYYILSAADPADVSGRLQRGTDRRQSVYRGMYLGGDMSVTSKEWIDANVRTNHGPLGALYPPKTWTAPNPHSSLKEGDTPSWFYFLRLGLSDPDHPEWGGWGGRYRALRSRVYNDAPESFEGAEDPRASVYRWRTAFQNDFAARMDWCNTSDPKQANHAPIASLNGDTSRAILTVPVASGTTVRLSADGSRDPDGNRLTYRWYVYPEAGTIASKIAPEGASMARVEFKAPEVNQPESIHLILEVTDNGHPSLTSWRRAVIAVQPGPEDKKCNDTSCWRYVRSACTVRRHVRCRRSK